MTTNLTMSYEKQHVQTSVPKASSASHSTYITGEYQKIHNTFGNIAWEQRWSDTGSCSTYIDSALRS